MIGGTADLVSMSIGRSALQNAPIATLTATFHA